MTYAAEVLADSPWGFWESAASTGALLNQSGPFAGEPAVAFAGPSSASTTATHTTNVSTQEVWLYLTSYPGIDTAVYSMWGTTDSHDRDMWIDSAGNVHWYYYPGFPVFLVTATPLTLNTWHHIVASVGPAGGKLRIDKTTVATNANTIGWTGQPQKCSLHLPTLVANGGASGETTMSFAAHAVYLTQLSDASTDAHYDAGMGSPASYPSLVLGDSPWGFWQFAETTGSALADSSGAARTMTLASAVFALPDSSGAARTMTFAGVPPTTGLAGPFASEPAIAWASGDAGSAATTAAHSVTVSTQEIWIYLTEYPAASTAVFSMWADATSHDRDMWIDTAGKVNWYFYTGSYIVIASPAALTLNTWHHIVASIGPAGAKLRIDKATVSTHVGTSGWNGTQKIGLHLSSLNSSGGGGGASGTGAMRLAAHAVFLTQLTDARTDAHYNAGITAIVAAKVRASVMLSRVAVQQASRW